MDGIPWNESRSIAEGAATDLLTRTRGALATSGLAVDVLEPFEISPRVITVSALKGHDTGWDGRTQVAETGLARDDSSVGPERIRVIVSGLVESAPWRECGGFDGVSMQGFAQGGAGDDLVPGPLLEVLTEQSVTGRPRLNGIHRPTGTHETADHDATAAAAASAGAGANPLAGIPGIPGADGVRDLTADELLGVMSAAERLQNRAAWLELCAMAEFKRRREYEQDTAIARGAPLGQRAGEFASEEIAWQTVRSGRAADERMELADALAARLPATMARLAEGSVNDYRALIIHRATQDLSPDLALAADQILAAVAPALTPEALRQRARRVVMSLDPEAAAKRKRRGKKEARVQSWQEDSGNAALAGREMRPEDVMAANSYYDDLAKVLRQQGAPGTLRELRLQAFSDLNTGKDPLDRIPGRTDGNTNGPASPSDPAGAADAASPDRQPELPDDEEQQRDLLTDDGFREDEPAGQPLDSSDDEDDDSSGDNGGNGNGPAARVPANIHLLVSAGTLLGWSNEPGEISRLGPVDPAAARDLVRTASRHPATRWCVTIVSDETGEAVAHGCATGQHPRAGSGLVSTSPAGNSRGSASDRAAQVAALVSELGVTFEPIAHGRCDHRHAEDRYTPSRKLRHLVQARTATCTAPACGARAVHNDLDHTVAWPDGPTCECNFGPPCRRHHRVKQAPGWTLQQPEPGIMRWTTPSGRVYTTQPTVYRL
ncbi:MAG TPA: DUF222 domain-containing protein [Trebonia sp.]